MLKLLAIFGSHVVGGEDDNRWVARQGVCDEVLKLIC